MREGSRPEPRKSEKARRRNNFYTKAEIRTIEKKSEKKETKSSFVYMYISPFDVNLILWIQTHSRLTFLELCSTSRLSGTQS